MAPIVVEGTPRSLTECRFMHMHGRHSFDNPFCTTHTSLCLVPADDPIEYNDGPDAKCNSCDNLGYIEDEVCCFPPCKGKMELI